MANKKRITRKRPVRKKPVTLPEPKGTQKPATAPKELTVIPLFIKSLCLSFLFAFTLLAITFIFILGYIYNKSAEFTEPAQTSLTELLQTGYAGWKTVPAQDNGKVNFLLLGSDALANRDSDRILTDTMIVTSVNLETGKVSLFSLPRDIWVPEYKMKINALYDYGKQQNPGSPESIPTDVVSKLVGIPLHHTIIIKLESLSQLVNIVGGVDVNIKEGFTDPLFPRSDIDVTKVKDPKLLYETVTFASGSAHMNGSDVLKYVRSRHASGPEGSDNARGLRQQEVILALTEKMKDPRFFYDLNRAGLLYHFYMTEFQAYLPMTEAIGIGKILQPNMSAISFSQATPSIFPTDKNGVIYHPTTTVKPYFGAWVYEIKDKAAFQAEAKKALNY